MKLINSPKITENAALQECLCNCPPQLPGVRHQFFIENVLRFRAKFKMQSCQHDKWLFLAEECSKPLDEIK